MSKYFENPSSDEIRALLRRIETIAVVGLSPRPYRPSHRVAKALRHAGYRVIPVNPNTTQVFNSNAYGNLHSVPIPIDLVDVFRAPRHVGDIVDECIALRIPALWLQDGVINETAALRAREAGIMVVMDRCMARDHSRLMR